MDAVLIRGVEVFQSPFDGRTEVAERFVKLPIERPLFHVLPQTFDQIQIW